MWSTTHFNSSSNSTPRAAFPNHFPCRNSVSRLTALSHSEIRPWGTCREHLVHNAVFSIIELHLEPDLIHINGGGSFLPIKVCVFGKCSPMLPKFLREDGVDFISVMKSSGIGSELMHD